MKRCRYTCPVCGRHFYAEADTWAFKRYVRKHPKLICSWKCLRAGEELWENPRRRRVRKEEE